MKTQKFNIVSISLGIFIGIILIACISATQSPSEEKTLDNTSNNESQNIPLDYQSTINENYKIYSLPMPENANFAGEVVPVDNILVKESLDKELLSNTYWHSNTFFYIKRAYRWFPLIEKILKENDVYSLLCPELDVASFGDTVEEAKAMLLEAATLHLEGAIEDGLPYYRPIPIAEDPRLTAADAIVETFHFKIDVAVHAYA